MSIIVKEICGKKFAVRAEKINDIDVINEVFVNDVYRLRELKARGVNPKFAIDVGGHIGTFSVLCKTLWPECQIVAFESVKENAALYRQNMELNGFQGVTIINKGINYDPKRTIFVSDKTTTGGGMFIQPNNLEHCLGSGVYFLEKDIDFSTLEPELAPFTFNSIDIAKFDCEGGEREAFRLMSDELLNKIKFVVGEFHGLGGNFEKFSKDYLFRLVNHTITVPERFKALNLGIFYAEPK